MYLVVIDDFTLSDHAWLDCEILPSKEECLYSDGHWIDLFY